jgi:hypothetical protein
MPILRLLATRNRFHATVLNLYDLHSNQPGEFLRVLCNEILQGYTLEEAELPLVPWTPLFIQEFQRSKPRLLGADATAVLGSQGLKRVRDWLLPTEPGQRSLLPPPYACRAARLAELLWPNDLGNDGCDVQGRWLGPVPLTSALVARVETELLRFDSSHDPRWMSGLRRSLGLLVALDEWSKGRESYPVYFPAVRLDAEDRAQDGRVLEARVTVIFPPDGVSMPTVALAPWTPLLLEPGSLGRLCTMLEAARGPDGSDEVRTVLRDAHFLLELSPFPSKTHEPPLGCQPPPTLQIEGDSLGLAVLLTAWAASEESFLVPLVATGALGTGGVTKVVELVVKLKAVADLPKATGTTWTFLVPLDGSSVLPSKPPPDVIVERVTTYKALFERQDLLIDPVPPYISRLAAPGFGRLTFDHPDAYSSEECVEYETLARELADKLARKEPFAEVITLPFDNDPEEMAAKWVACLAARMSEKLKSSRTALPAPLLIPLDAIPAGLGGLPLSQRMEEGVRRRSNKVWGGKPSGEASRFERFVHNCLRQSRDRLLLIVCGAKSSSMDPTKHLEALRTLRAFLEEGEEFARRPSLVFIASDSHHERLIKEEIRLVEWNTAPATARNPFRYTFLRRYQEEQHRVAGQPIRGLLDQRLLDVTNDQYLTKLAIELKVCPRDTPSDAGVSLATLLDDADQRCVVLFDRVGAGKRTAARQLFHQKLFLQDSAREPVLPIWLEPAPDGNCAAVERAIADALGFEEARVRHWLRFGPPVLLLVELHHFTKPREAFARIGEFLSANKSARAVVMLHSNQAGDRKLDRLGNCVYYGVNRVEPDDYKEYAKQLSKPLGCRVPERPPGRWDRFGHEGLSPQLMHLLCLCPENEQETGMASGVFQQVASRLLENQWNNDETIGLKVYEYIEKIGEWFGAIAFVFYQSKSQGELSCVNPEEVDYDTIVAIAAEDPKLGEAKRKAIDDPSSFFFQKIFFQNKGDQLRFISGAFQAYFAGGYFLAALAKGERPDYDAMLRHLTTWRTVDPLVAEFLGGSLGRGQLESLILFALTSKRTQDETANLPRILRALCKGANPEHPAIASLLSGRGTMGWQCLEDPHLVRGELHGLLAAHGSAGFANALANGLESHDWVERRWPLEVDDAKTADLAAGVTALWASPDRAEVAAGDAAGEVTLWDVDRRDLRRRRQMHVGRARVLVELRHGGKSYLISGGDDGSVRLWDHGTGEVRGRPHRHSGKVLALAVLAGRSRPPLVVSAGEDGRLYLWSPFADDWVRSLRAHFGPITLLCQLDDFVVASGGEDGRVRVWDLETADARDLKPTLFAPPHPRPVTQIHRGNGHFLWGDVDGHVYLSRGPYREGGVAGGWQRHAGAVTGLSFHGSMEALSAGADGRAGQWNWTSPVPDPPLPAGHNSPIRGLSYSGAGSAYVTGTGMVYRMGGPAHYDRHPGPVAFMQSVGERTAGRWVTAGGRLLRIGPAHGLIGDARRHQGPVTAVALFGGGFVSGGWGGSVRLFRAEGESYELDRYWPAQHGKPVAFLAVAGQAFASAGLDGRVCVRGVAGPEVLLAWRGAPITALRGGGEGFVWGDATGQVFRWDRGQSRAERIGRFRDAVAALDTHLDEATTGAPPEIVVMAVTNNGELFRLAGGQQEQLHKLPHLGRIAALRCVGPRCYVLATDAGVYRGAGRSSPQPFPGELSAFDAAPDGRIVCGTPTGRLWSPGVEPYPAHREEVVGVRLPAGPGAGLVVSASRDGVVKIARLDSQGVEVLAGYPAGNRVTSLDVREKTALAGLVDGDVVVLGLHVHSRAEGGPT